MPWDHLSFLISSPTLRTPIVSSIGVIRAIFRRAESGSAPSFSIFSFIFFHVRRTNFIVWKSVGKRRKRLHRGVGKKCLLRTTELWIKRRKCGDERTRTVGEITTLAAARGKKKKASNVDTEWTIPSAPAINVWTCGEAFNEVHLWYIHIRRVYIYKYWTYFADRTSSDGTVFMLRACQAHVWDCACDCMAGWIGDTRAP